MNLLFSLGLLLALFPRADRLERGLAPAPAPASTSPTVAGFAVRYGAELSRYRVNAAFVMPGQPLALAIDSAGNGTYRLDASHGRLERGSASSWTWRAPTAPGLYPLTVRGPDGVDSVRLNVFVLRPATRVVGERMNGYLIGRYPRSRGAPVGYVEVTPANRKALVSPNFRLEQFLCKQAGGFPKYVVLSERLIFALETLLRQVNEAGYRATTFHVMSGYRTPAYNRAIGNVSNSRHLWGEAVDVFIDEDGNGVMDDLNGDGRSDAEDARILHDIAERVLGTDGEEFAGGLGLYSATPRHGPFVHVDVRGFRARW